MAEHEIKITIGAKDEATKQIKAIDKELTKLQKDKATLEVDANTEAAQKQLAEVSEQIEKLQTEKAEIEVEAKVTQALSALEDVASEAKKAELAAEKLSDAVGPELVAGANVDAIVADFERMGLSLDDIIANADRLGAKLKEVGAQQPGGSLDAALKRTRGSVDDVGRSADSSKSALANMVGNAAQDVGSLGGLAGSAGVAIGQMAEYMADASLSGEKLGSVLKNFATVAGPIAAIAAAVGIFSSVMGSLKAQAAAAAERTDAIGEAMKEGADDALAFTAVLRDNAEAMRDYIAMTNDPLGNFGVQVDELMSKIPALGGLFKEAGVDIFEVASRAGLSIYDLAQAIEDGGKVGGGFTDKLLAAADAGKITDDEFAALSEVMVKYGDSAVLAAKKLGLFNVDQEEANALLDEMLTKRNPLSRYKTQWNTLFDDLRDGAIDTKAAADAINYLSEQLGIVPSEVISIAFDKINEKGAEVKSTAEVARRRLQPDQRGDAPAGAGRRRLRRVLGRCPRCARRAGRRVLDPGPQAGGDGGRVRGRQRPARRSRGDHRCQRGDPRARRVHPRRGCAGHLRPQRHRRRPVPVQDRRAPHTDPGGHRQRLRHRRPGRRQADRRRLRAADRRVDARQAHRGTGADPARPRRPHGDDPTSPSTRTPWPSPSSPWRILVGLKGETPWTAEIALPLAAGEITPQTAQALINERLQGAGVEDSRRARPDRQHRRRGARRPTTGRPGPAGDDPDPAAADLVRARLLRRRQPVGPVSGRHRRRRSARRSSTGGGWPPNRPMSRPAPM